MDKITKQTIVSIIIVFIIIIILGLIKQCNKPVVESNEMYEHLQDSITTYKNKYGESVAVIQVLQASNTSTLLELKTKDETILWLQKEVKDAHDKIKSGGSISIVGTEILFTGKNGTTITFDTSKPPIMDDDEDASFNKTVYLYPEYSSTSKDTTWIKYSIKANKDTTTLDLSVKNKYSVLIGSKRDKWYKPKYPIVEVTTKNPYDKVKTLRAFEVKDNQKTRLGLGLSVGWGVNPKGIQPYLGIGLNYTLIKF